MFPILHLGPLAIQLPGLVLILGLWTGLSLSEKKASYLGLQTNRIYQLVMITLMIGIIAGRVVEVITHSEAFLLTPVNVVSLNPALFDSKSAIIIGLAAGWLYLLHFNLPIWRFLDALTPLGSTLVFSFGLAHLSSGSAYGSPADVPWSINLWGADRHPTQVYEMILGAFLLVVFLPNQKQISKKSKGYLRPGGLFLLFICLLAAGRLLIEGFRGDSLLIMNSYRQVQVICWFGLAFSLLLLGRKQYSGNENTPHTQEAEIVQS